MSGMPYAVLGIELLVRYTTKKFENNLHEKEWTENQLVFAESGLQGVYIYILLSRYEGLNSRLRIRKNLW